MLERRQVVPNIYEGYYEDGKNEVVKRYNDFYQVNLSPWQDFFWQSTIDRKVYLGDQHFLNRYANIAYEQQKFIFNKAMKLWNVVGGHQRKHRKATRVVPVHEQSNNTSSQLTQVLQHAYRKSDAYNKISDAFDEAGIVGLSLMHSWMDYRFDPVCGDLRHEVITADMMMMDAFWKEMDLSDCMFIANRKYLNKELIKQMIPSRANDIDRINDIAYYDTKYTFMPQQYNIRRKGILAYDEFWYQDQRKQIIIIDPETYESIAWEGDDEKLEEIRRMFPNVIVTKSNVPTVKLAIIINDVCFYDGPNPLGIDEYPYTPLVAYHDTANNNYAYRYQGLIRGVRDAQYIYCYRKQLELDLLAAQFSGVDVEVDSLIDNEDAFKIGPGKVRFFKKGKLGALRDVPGANLNPVNAEITQLIGKEMEEISGITPELLGMSEDSDVGITTMLRQGAALTTLQKLFDHIDIFQRHLGKKDLKIIQKNYTIGKIKRIIKENPTDEFSNNMFQEYDCVIENAPMTATTRQLTFVQLYQMWKDGMPIPISSLFEYLDIQDKDKIVEQMQKDQQQQQQMQQQQTQLQMQNQQIVNENLKSKAFSDMALGQERLAKIETDRAVNEERITKSHQERDQGILENIKAAKELESMDLNHLEKAMNIIMSIKQSKMEEENVQLQEQSGIQGEGQTL